jgi:UDP-2,4-diacetamido-2,4,6-trideoxy-beta-L-altropyranose hydrolase
VYFSNPGDVNPQLLVRADCNAGIGTGHVMRCLALAQAWQDHGGRATYAVAACTRPIEDRLRAEEVEIVHLFARPGSTEDAVATIETARGCSAAWTVLDGHHFDGEYQRLLKQAGTRLLAVDDFGHAGHYWADLILNQNANATADFYVHRDSRTRLLLGPEYTMLRREFAPRIGQPRSLEPQGLRWLVTMGGSDPGNMTPTLIEGLDRAGVAGLTAVVVVGAANTNFDRVLAASRAGQVAVELRTCVRDMAGLMAETDAAIAGAGGTLWELMSMGCPTMTFSRTPLQESIFRDLQRRGTLVYLGGEDAADPQAIAAAIRGLAFSEATRRRLSQNGRDLIDGRGTLRIMQAMQETRDEIALDG